MLWLMTNSRSDRDQANPPSQPDTWKGKNAYQRKDFVAHYV